MYHSLECLQQAPNVELMQELNTPSYVEVMRAVQFFAQVIVNLDQGAEAFIEAQGPDVLVALNRATPPGMNFFFVHTFDGEESLWAEAIHTLIQYSDMSQHQLLATVQVC